MWWCEQTPFPYRPPLGFDETVDPLDEIVVASLRHLQALAAAAGGQSATAVCCVEPPCLRAAVCGVVRSVRLA